MQAPRLNNDTTVGLLWFICFSGSFWQWQRMQQSPWLVEEALGLPLCSLGRTVWSWIAGKTPWSPCSSETRSVAQTCPPLLRAPGGFQNLTNVKSMDYVRKSDLESNSLIWLRSKEEVLPLSIRRLYLMVNSYLMGTNMQQTNKRTVQEKLQGKCDNECRQQWPLGRWTTFCS